MDLRMAVAVVSFAHRRVQRQSGSGWQRAKMALS